MKSSVYPEWEVGAPVRFDGDVFLKPDAEAVLTFLKNSHESIHLHGVQESALSYLIARGLSRLRQAMVLIAPSEREAEQLFETVSFFMGRDPQRPDAPLLRRVWYFPSRTARKSQSLGKMETTARRLETLYAIRTGTSPLVVVTSALALLERLMPPALLVEHVDYRVKGEDLDLDSFCRRLIERGYYPVSLVEEYGDLSRRGGVLDLYAPLYQWPLRLEFFGDELDSIRLFHPV